MYVNPFSIRNKIILITGASSGIGRATAIACSQLGASVILLGRNIDRLNETYMKLNKGKHSIYSLELTKFQEIEPIIEKCVSEYGKIDGFVHCAGKEITIPLQQMKPSLYEDIFQTNVISGFELAKIISKKKFINSIGGSFVFISSVRSILGYEAAIAYCSSKGAINAGVRAMALELVAKKIRVNCISPAFVETEMTLKYFNTISEETKTKILQMHPFGISKPYEIANTCIFLLSDAARSITGSNLIIDGGYSIK